MNRLQHECRVFAVAVQFLTRLPTPQFTHWDAAWLRDCVRYFPLVGMLIGGCGAAVMWGASGWWSPAIAATLGMLATIVLTGAFHEDGLADTFDALGGSVSRERALEIMKDSRIGTYGACALALIVGLRVLALTTLISAHVGLAAAALMATHAVARLAPVWVMARLPYAGDTEHAKAKPLAQGVGFSLFAVACLWALFIAGALAWALPHARLLPGAACAIVATIVVAAWMTLWLRNRLGGYTGDTLGATEQLSETAILLALAASWNTAP